MDNMDEVEMFGFLERKHEQQSGGKRAAIRSWKTYYTVLCGQLLCFFKEQEDFIESKAAASPLNLYQANCERASDYTKRKNVFRVRTSDGAEFLFGAEDSKSLDEWVKKIAFHAALSPAQQLMSYDNFKKGRPKAARSISASALKDHVQKELEKEEFHSAASTPPSSAESKRKLKESSSTSSIASSNKQSVPQRNKEEVRPPPPPPPTVVVQQTPPAVPQTPPVAQQAPPVLPKNAAPARPISVGDEVWIRRNAPYPEVDFPPLPRSAPPPLPPSRPPIPPRSGSQHVEPQRQSVQLVSDEWRKYYSSSTYETKTNYRTTTLPGHTTVDGHSSIGHQRPASAADIRSDTSSECDMSPATISRKESKEKDGKEKRSSVLGLFRRKGRGPHV